MGQCCSTENDVPVQGNMNREPTRRNVSAGHHDDDPYTNGNFTAWMAASSIPATCDSTPAPVCDTSGGEGGMSSGACDTSGGFDGGGCDASSGCD